jgi:hypothetical protein
MGQARVDVIVAVNWVDLGLAAQATEGPGENHPVMILVERAAAKFFRTVHRFAEAFTVKQGLPIQG